MHDKQTREYQVDEEIQVKRALVTNAHRAYETKLQTGNGGNISGRISGTNLVIIKASACSFEQISTDNLVTVTLDGEQIAGDGAPSRELQTHLIIYKLRPDVQYIFHCHSPWSILCSSNSSSIPTVTHHAKQKLNQIPILNQLTDDALKILLMKNYNLQVFVHSHHGIFSFANTIELARYNAELVEETAQIAWYTVFREQMLSNHTHKA